MTSAEILQRAKDLSSRLRAESRQVRSGVRSPFYGDHSDGGITIAQIVDDLCAALTPTPDIGEMPEQRVGILKKVIHELREFSPAVPPYYADPIKNCCAYWVKRLESVVALESQSLPVPEAGGEMPEYVAGVVTSARDAVSAPGYCPQSAAAVVELDNERLRLTTRLDEVESKCRATECERKRLYDECRSLSGKITMADLLAFDRDNEIATLTTRVAELTASRDEEFRKRLETKALLMLSDTANEHFRTRVAELERERDAMKARMKSMEWERNHYLDEMTKLLPEDGVVSPPPPVGDETLDDLLNAWYNLFDDEGDDEVDSDHNAREAIHAHLAAMVEKEREWFIQTVETEAAATPQCPFSVAGHNLVRRIKARSSTPHSAEVK